MAAPGSAVSQLRLLATGLAPAVTAACAAVILTHPDEVPLVGLVLLILLVPIGVFQPVPGLALAVGAAGGAYQLVLALSGFDPAGPWAALAAPGFLLVGAAAESFGKECAHVDAQRARVARLVEDLTPTDSVTGVTKWSHAQPTFVREVARARRHKQPLALLMVAPERWERLAGRLGHEKAKQVVAEIGAHMVGACRNVDVVAYRDGATFGLLLPDTPLAGAEVVARRISGLSCATAEIRLRAGVAMLHDEMRDVDALVHDAEMALAIAERLGRPWLVSRGGEVDEAPTEPGAPDASVALPVEAPSVAPVAPVAPAPAVVAATGAGASAVATGAGASAVA